MRSMVILIAKRTELSSLLQNMNGILQFRASKTESRYEGDPSYLENSICSSAFASSS